MFTKPQHGPRVEGAEHTNGKRLLSNSDFDRGIRNRGKFYSNQIRYNTKKANWGDYYNHSRWKELKKTKQEDTTIDKFYQVINEVARDTIPQHTTSSFYPKSWWNAQLQYLKEKREQAYRRYRNNKSLSNMMAWKRQSNIQIPVKNVQEKIWTEMTSSINSKTSPMK